MLLLNGVKKVLKCIFLNKLLIIKDIFKLKNCKVSIILFLCTPPNIINYTAEDHRRIDYTIVVEHREEVEKVKKVILEVLSEGELVLKEPTPSIDIISYETNKVVLQLKFWIVGNDISDILAVFLKELFDKTTKENLLFSIQRKS